MGLVAVLGDIHGNKEAWDAINRSIAKKIEGGAEITDYICTGDIVGYGPDPRAILQGIYQAQKAGNWTVVKGNHDNAATSKLEHAEAAIGKSIGIKGLGSYEGIHWAVRQLCGDLTVIPKKTAELDALDEGSDQYELVLHEWKKTQVESHTQEVVKKAHDHVSTHLQALLNILARSGNGLPITQRFFGRSEGIKKASLESALNGLSLTELQAAQYHLGQYSLCKENEELRNYLSKLPSEIRTVIKSGDVSVPVFLVHDNPFEPGNTKYVVDRKSRGREKLGISSSVHHVDEIFGEWDARWPDTKVIFFGHSHIPGVYSDDKGRLVINPGSVGIPRGDALEATYALWNPAVEGKDSVEIVRIKRAGWRMTREKMKVYGLPDKFEHVHAEVS